MDAQKIAFLFEDTPQGEDPDDQEVRRRLVEERVRASGPVLDDEPRAVEFLVLMHQLVADQIATDNPPEVWGTARRLLDAGLRSAFVMSNLVLALNVAVSVSLEGDEGFDEERYFEELDRLPLPPVREMFETFTAVARQHRSVSYEELLAVATASFAGVSDVVGGQSETTENWINRALDELLIAEPSMMMLPPDRIVHVPTLMQGVMLTHRLTESEQERGWMATGADLAPLLCWSEDLLWPDGTEVDIGPGEILEGTPGWLHGFQPGALIGFRVEADTLSLLAVEDPGPPGPDVVASARAAYDLEVAEPWLPVGSDEILVGMLVDRPDLLSTPTVPLSELLAQAGLEQRGSEFAHEDSVWRQARNFARMDRLDARVPDADSRRRAARLFDLLDAEERDSDKKREALATLGDFRLLAALTDALLDLDDDQEQLQEVSAFAEDLLLSARRPAEGAPAHWLLAVICERREDPLGGQAQLELALRVDPDFAPAIDRLAWYLSDRGDAAGAARLWRRLGLGEEEDADLREVAPFAASPVRSAGRNEPCWCGSGRKFKHCHLGEPATFPLPDRVGWLCRKAIAFLERRGGSTFEDVYDHAVIRADGDDSDEAVDRAFADPMVMDVVLHEGEWFERFLAERGALLPDDEAMLAAAWALVDRTLYEVVETRPSQSMVVRDLRTAELIEVRERTFSRQARVGQVVCGRAVPDGETNQFIGGIVAVATGQEKDLLDLLDERDGEELLAWVAARERPPRLSTREGEDLRSCRAVVEVPDPAAARVVLDRRYGPEADNCWRERHQLANGESILRASMTLEDGRITVETMSEPRVERVLDVLTNEIDGATVISDERRDMDRIEPPPGLGQSLSPDDPAVKEALRTFIAERERAWCDEEIPALGGLTPRQAAADPAGREGLERLLAEYGTHVDPQQDPELVTQHPDRLRRLLGFHGA